ncbi:HipA domain-containing protein [Arthrobacter sp. MI7-26]|uniref:HipA domain-containing protein n=1 Tax=Arthrobacter sp. MI7-26 TaxID=2993653 RepID=UPI0022493AE5|nr:HipA domain-containing protein [Arthrobacter sp. MI7-26]MCX2746997.1 HipA domain-containing protein [Arthrobacter sp. MI7-26]
MLKPATGPFSRLDVVEQMTMHAASVLGNDVAKSEIVSIGKWDVFVTERYDRALDARAKNYSLLLRGNNVSLAPLYDLATYAPYWDGTSRIDSAMNVGGEYSLERISRSNLAALGPKFGLSIDQANETVTEVSSGVVRAFESARARLENQGPQVRAVADDVLGGLVKLPLVGA